MICDIANDFDLSAEFFGRILLEDGVLLTLDEEALLARAAQQTHSLLGRAAQR